jgi:myo-inositol 2-dehydrogenase/D-chiro-inositol 1-dehydrogenase
MASIDNSRKSAYGYDQHLEVFGDLGITASNNKLTDSHYFADSDGIHNSLPLGFFIERYSESYLLILKKFIYCLLENKEIPNNSKAGLNALLISLAAKKSFEENRVVELNEFNN